MDRIAHCAACVAREQGLAELPKADGTADTGTNVHAAMETGDDEDLDLTEAEIKAKLVEMERVALANWRAEFNIEEGHVKVVREERLWLHDRLTLKPIASGRLDVYAMCFPYAMAVDYKTGFKKPTASEINWQLRTQAVLLRKRYPDLTHIRVAIAHSRLTSKWDAADYDEQGLEHAERDVLTVLRRAQDPHAPACPGPWCRWCRAQGVCRENAVYHMMGSDKLSTTKDPIGVIQAVQRMTPEEMAYIWDRKATVASLYETLEHRLKNLPSGVLASIGYKLVDGNKTYPIAKEEVAGCYTKLKTVLSDVELVQCIKLQMGDIYKAVAEKQKCSKDAAKDKVIELLGLEMKLGNPRLKAL